MKKSNDLKKDKHIFTEKDYEKKLEALKKESGKDKKQLSKEMISDLTYLAELIEVIEFMYYLKEGEIFSERVLDEAINFFEDIAEEVEKKWKVYPTKTE